MLASDFCLASPFSRVVAREKDLPAQECLLPLSPSTWPGTKEISKLQVSGL